jgi:hypothetical protein
MQCTICGSEIEVVCGWSEGHNASPVVDGGRCCSRCNSEIVVPTRLAEFLGRGRDQIGALSPTAAARTQPHEPRSRRT